MNIMFPESIKEGMNFEHKSDQRKDIYGQFIDYGDSCASKMELSKFLSTIFAYIININIKLALFLIPPEDKTW